MASSEDIRQNRISKLQILKELGINPYPVKTNYDYTLGDLVKNFESVAKSGKQISLVGRVMAIRSQGAITFITFNDGTGQFQALLKKDELKEGEFDLFTKVADIGDFVEICGTLFVTKRGEKTIQAKDWKMLSKSLLPLPEKWHGLQDVEERFRHRYLDTLMSPDVKSRFLLRSRIISLIRKFYDGAGYIEVETPRLQLVPGGATARPFVTHHNALDADFYLTIAQELYLKKLLVGGFTKVYEIGRKFRNEGIDVTHNPEFTMLESNEAYSDAEEQRKFIEKLFKYLVKTIFAGKILEYDGNSIDFSKKFTVITFYDLLKQNTKIKNPESVSLDEATSLAKELHIEVGQKESLDKILDGIYKKTCRPKLIQPTFIVDYPVSFNPFAKRKEGDEKIIDRFQLVVGGIEIVNAFSELNNPLDQKERYLEQDEKKKGGESEISPSDLEYLNAMEYGMPPNGGIGIGIDRVAMLFTNVKNIKEVILFPTMRPERG